VLPEGPPQQRDEVRHRRGEVDDGRRERLLSGEGEELAGKRCPALRRPGRALDPLRRAGVAVELGPDEFKVPRMTCNRLLKSCAMPPVSCPMACIFWASRSTPSAWARLVMSETEG
jgi:hypothetical protein